MRTSLASAGADAGAHGEGCGDRHLIRWHDHGRLDRGRRGRGEGVHVGRGTVHRAGEALGDDVCHAEAVGVAAGLLGQAEVDHALHRRAARGSGRRVAARDVRVGAVARDVLPDLIYDENVDVVERQPRQVALRLFEERRFGLLQLLGGDRDYLAWLFVGVLDGGEAEGDLAALDGDAGCLGDGLVDVLPARGVDGVRPPLLAEPDGEHLRRPALDRSPERRVGLDPVDDHDRVGLVGVPVHVDWLHPRASPRSSRSPSSPARDTRRSPRSRRGARAPPPGPPRSRRRGSPSRGLRRARRLASFRASTSAATTSPILRYPPAPYADGHRARRQLHGVQRLADALPDVRERRRRIYPLPDERDAGEFDGAQGSPVSPRRRGSLSALPHLRRDRLYNAIMPAGYTCSNRGSPSSTPSQASLSSSQMWRVGGNSSGGPGSQRSRRCESGSSSCL